MKNFIGNRKTRNNTELVGDMLTAPRNLACNTNIKMHYVFSLMDRLAENQGSMSDEQDGRVHQDMRD